MSDTTKYPKELHFVCDGPPGPEAGRFVETEDEHGRGVGLGRWVERKDGLWALVVPMPFADEIERLTSERDSAMSLVEASTREGVLAEAMRRADEAEALVERLRAELITADARWRNGIERREASTAEIERLTRDNERRQHLIARISDAAGYCESPIKNPLQPLDEFVGAMRQEIERLRAVVDAARNSDHDGEKDDCAICAALKRLEEPDHA